MCCAGLSAQALRHQPGLISLVTGLNLALLCLWGFTSVAGVAVAAHGGVQPNPARTAIAAAGMIIAQHSVNHQDRGCPCLCTHGHLSLQVARMRR